LEARGPGGRAPLVWPQVNSWQGWRNSRHAVGAISFPQGPGGLRGFPKGAQGARGPTGWAPGALCWGVSPGEGLGVFWTQGEASFGPGAFPSFLGPKGGRKRVSKPKGGPGGIIFLWGLSQGGLSFGRVDRIWKAPRGARVGFGGPRGAFWGPQGPI